MNSLYLSRSIRCRALELMKKLSVDSFLVKFDDEDTMIKFTKLLGDIGKETRKLGKPFKFEHEGFQWCTVSGQCIEFSSNCDNFNNNDDVMVDIHYFLSWFPIKDHVHILEDVLDYSL